MMRRVELVGCAEDDEGMEMSQYKPIFQDASTPVDEILAAIGSAGWLAKSMDVGVMQAAHAIDGEMWAPQLTPYTEWKPRGDGRSATEHDGDLFKVGSLHMGADNELRERMVALGLEAARKMAEQAKVGTPASLHSSHRRLVYSPLRVYSSYRSALAPKKR